MLKPHVPRQVIIATNAKITALDQTWKILRLEMNILDVSI